MSALDEIEDLMAGDGLDDEYLQQYDRRIPMSAKNKVKTKAKKAAPVMKRKPVKAKAKPRRVVAEPVQPGKSAVTFPAPALFDRETGSREKQAKTMLAAVTKLEVKSQADEQKLVGWLSNYKTFIGEINTFFEPLTTPIEEVLAKLEARRKEIVGPVTEAITLGKSKLDVYYDEIEKEREAAAAADLEEQREREKTERMAVARKKAKAMFAEGKTPEQVSKFMAEFLGRPSEIEETPITERATPSAEGAQRRGLRTVVITDENLIPDEFWVIDEVALRKAVLKDGRKIPGTKIGKKNSIAVSAAQRVEE
jgi:hypothetical protein